MFYYIRMELSFILYIFAALISIPGVFFIFSYMRMFLAGGIAAIGLFILFIFFGIQYYNADGTYTSTAVSSTGPWPPSINMCPDFLSLYKVGSGANVNLYCVDTVGVSTSANNPLTIYVPFTAASGATSPATPTDGHKFNLFLKDTDYPNTSNPTKLNVTYTGACLTKNRNECLKQQCMYRGLTWAGFWDGAQLLGTAEPPRPTA